MMVFFFLISSFIFSLENYITKNSFLLRFGYYTPVFGHFGDKDSGFRGNFSYGIMYTYEYDDIISFGVIIEDTSYLSSKNTPLEMKFFSFTPSVFLKASYSGFDYLYFGFGVYHWTSPSVFDYESTSDDEFGFRLGYERFFSIKKIKFGGGFEWNHVIGVKGKNFDLGSINIVVPHIIIRYDF